MAQHTPKSLASDDDLARIFHPAYIVPAGSNERSSPARRITADPKPKLAMPDGRLQREEGQKAFDRCFSGESHRCRTC